MTSLSRTYLWILAPLLAFMLILIWTHSAAATAEDCRTAAVKLAGTFAKKRTRQTLACAAVGGCDEMTLAAKKARLRSRSLAELAAACKDVSAADLGLGPACPDASGRCPQALDSPGALIDCMLCMVSETVDPLLQRLQGEPAAVAQTCGGCAASECEAGAYCEPPVGLCEGVPEVGVCVEMPEACSGEAKPVCGCDGVTYENDCVRRQHRVGLLHAGPCKLTCGSAEGDVCPDGTFCEGLPGRCDAPADGVCVPVPDACIEVFEPVCGCDGVTYGNDCKRRAAGVRLLHVGACADGCAPDGCIDETQYCELPPGTCESSGEGKCLPRPEVCPEYFAPVCGCDGVTYGNDCERAAAGVSKRHDGACDSVCGGIQGVPCAEGEFCELPAGMCDFADLQGSCVTKPLGCPDYYDPVCSCDGVTYGNDCDRRAAGAHLAHFGQCTAGCVPATDDCGADAVCLPPLYTCEYPLEGGKCFPVSPVCPLSAAPFPLVAVCGCDGQTYDSVCEAIRSGVQVAHEGPCEAESRCVADAECATGERCVPVPGLCLLVMSPMMPEACIAVPDTCPPDDQPVCGCDLQTYASACEANQAGAGVAYWGKCFN